MKRNTAIFNRVHAMSIARVLAVACGVAVVACGQAASDANHACPCETGFVCCQSNVCVAEGSVCPVAVQCPSGIMLGSSLDAGTNPTGVMMIGTPLGSLPDGEKIPFNFASSASTQNGQITLQGWMVDAGGGLTLTFDAFASDGTSSAPLQLVAYGPTTLGPSDGTCFAVLAGGASMATGPSTFNPPNWGQYFVAPYHPVDVATDGTLSVSNNPNNTAAFLEMNVVAK